MSRRGFSAYWLLPVLLAGIQAWVSWGFCHEIRGEELAESVRNVYWLEHRLLYDGVSSNVGWYATLLLFYKLCGFSLYSAKVVRLIFQLIGLTCAADLLRRNLGAKMAVVPLLLFGLSPTVLYFGAMQTSFGLDFPFAAICLWLLLASLRPGGANPGGCALAFLGGLLAMVAALSYPGFLLYFPSFAVVLFCAPAGERPATPPDRRARWLRALGVSAGLVLPFAAALLYVSPARMLLYDPATHSGVFRGGGQIGFDLPTARHSLAVVLRDLFVRGESYYFELHRPEFSGWLAPIGLGWVGLTVAYLGVKRRVSRLAVGAALLLLALNLILPNLSVNGLPGLRRCTGVIVACFVLFTLAWAYYAGPNGLSRWRRRAGMALCLLLPLSSALKLPSLLADASRDSQYRVGDWFALRGTPTASLAYVIDQVDRGRVLAYYSRDGGVVPCRYQEIYAAVAGSRLWNRQEDAPILARDWRTGQVIRLTPELWTSYYFPH
jgi:hypothetical protein